MKKITIIPLITIILLIFSSYIYALDSGINMNLTGQNVQTTPAAADNTAVTAANTAPSDSAAPVSSPAVTSAGTTPEESLFSSGNILNIILITIGIVLILLGIAIFIRAK